MIPDLFHSFLCGARTVEHTQATMTQMYSPTNGWARAVLDTLEIPLHIRPEVVVPGTQLGPVRPEVLRDTGFSSTFPVVAVASHDTASAVAAIPNMDEASVFISSGIWSLMGVELREPIASDEAFSLGFTNEGVPEGPPSWCKTWQACGYCRSASGNGAARERRTHGLALLRWRLPHRHSHVCSMSTRTNFACPEICPELLPILPPHPATGTRVDRRGRAQLLRKSDTEISLCIGIAAIRDRGRLETIRVVGGGCLNALLCQMTTYACNRVVVSSPAEASAFGNVMQQAIATGHLPSVAE